MDRKEFETRLAAGTLPSALLFEGEEEYLKSQAYQALRRRLLPEGMEEMNETLLEAPDAGAIIAAAETLPFLAEKRLVLLRDYPALTGRTEADEQLLDYLPNIPSTTLLCFYCTQKADGRKKLYSAIKKLGGVVTFAPLRDRELTAFVTNAFRQQGKECDERTADFLIFTCGSDTNLLLSEVAKIAAHSASPSVHPDEIKALATPSAECTVFQMVDAVVSGQEANALSLFRNQLRSGADRVYILAMLLRQFRLLQHVKIMQFEKRSAADIRSALGVPSFAVEQYVRQAAGYSNVQVKQAVQLCFDTETAIKSGRLNAEGAVEAVMIKLLNFKKKS